MVRGSLSAMHSSAPAWRCPTHSTPSTLSLPASPPLTPPANAACVNTAGGYTCQCHLTYVGDGRTCVEVPGARAAVEDLFFTDNKREPGLSGVGGAGYTAEPWWAATGSRSPHLPACWPHWIPVQPAPACLPARQ